MNAAQFTLIHDYTRRGFHITFENGWTISVQWGAGTYSDNHDAFSRYEVKNTSADYVSLEKAILQLCTENRR